MSEINWDDFSPETSGLLRRADLERPYVEILDGLIACGEADDFEDAMEMLAEYTADNFVYLIRTRRIDYQRYLESRHWQRMRELARDAAGNRCQLCNSTDRLETHHKTYDHIGRELLSELIVLCRDCHAKFHGKLP